MKSTIATLLLLLAACGLAAPPTWATPLAGAAAENGEGGEGGEEEGSVNAVIAHGICMVLAWILFSPSAIFIAHFLKFLGQKWFLLHKYMQIIATLLTVAGFIAILSGGEAEAEGAHGSLGIFLLVCTLIQALLGFARNLISGEPTDPNDPKDHGPRRWMFNYMHWLLGALTTVIAIVTIYLGLDLVEIGTPGFTALYVWLGVEAFVVLVSLVINHREGHSNNVLLAACGVFAAAALACTIVIAVKIGTVSNIDL
ncbi:hypothetical protein PTSG_10325 [Salpingoeca rosetta]|uniref:Cytochrome b561 domain-containing protein n=1 Tax=Salpingoeca rosetta (strain ATCC 50818 / BSB-021) TaxID=946362 RepID=F2UQZ4_SALR5|nr:uncharacterized protein PTSG_10325 [Salpingoeca rosetta]EGD80049.1 hypothetical protein PTSG_10325 [Salpingoeca rosetta]|eukprot:XP_004988374.1 hypothetical protein PTSG_10325 [Salpingoeca rosetta]